MSLVQQQDDKWMSYALSLADNAEAQGEIPVGAVIVLEGEVIGEGWNQSITLNDPTAHAEVMALRDAGQRVDNYRVINATLYVTLEPCPMCAGALVHSRVARVVYGAADLKTGAAGSVMNLLDHENLNHQPAITAGIMAEECSSKISEFFRKRRAEKKQAKQQLKKAQAAGSPHRDKE